MTERKFTRGLHKPGMAAQLRESVSQVVRESAVLNQHLLVEPIDFEHFVVKNKTLIQNDPQRELLLYPNEDVSQVVLPRKCRTIVPDIPAFAPPTIAATSSDHDSVDHANHYNQSLHHHQHNHHHHHHSQHHQHHHHSHKDLPLHADPLTGDTLSAGGGIPNSKSGATTSTNSSSDNDEDSADDETYVSAASSESNLAACSITSSASNANGGVGGVVAGTSVSASASAAAISIAAASAGGYTPEATTHGLLLTRQALHTYHSNHNLIVYKFAQYGRGLAELPRLVGIDDELADEVYEIDTDPDRIDEQMTRSQADTITKQGYLLKGPDTSSDRIFVHIGSKSFKRRYCYLRQEVDGTYILELHKDERQGDAKTTYVMDFCTAVVQNHKRGRFCFELCMTAGHKSVTLAAESEADLADWLGKFTTVVQQHKLLEDKRLASLERASGPPSSASSTLSSASSASLSSSNMAAGKNAGPGMFGTLKGLDQSMNPQLMRYGRETDVSIAQARREKRRHLFNVYRTSPTRSLSTMAATSAGSPIAAAAGQMTVGDTVEPYREKFGHRILLKCENLRFRLQAPIQPPPDATSNTDVDAVRQVEPYFTSLALYDARAGRKLTENFYFDINDDLVADMFDNADRNHRNTANAANSIMPAEWRSQLPANWFRHPRRALFSISAPHPDIFVVVKIDKILQGSINSSAEPYLKASKDPKLALKLHRNALLYNQKIGRYRMPFAWAARPLFRQYSSELDTTSEFPAIYRQDANRLRDEELLRILSEYRKPDKLSKMTLVPGWLKVTVESVVQQPNHSLTTSLVPLKPFPMQFDAELASQQPTVEVAEFHGPTERDVNPYVTFVNHLFVYPLSINFESQKFFSRARNLSVYVELRETDSHGAKSLPCIYGRPPDRHGQFVERIACPVLHHSTTPTWYEEIKLRLPLNLTAQHHLLFSFVHVSCDLSKKRDAGAAMENAVGYAWLPLLQKGRINVDEQSLAVAATLPAGYLSIQPLGLGRGNSGPDIHWIDSQRPLFTVAFQLDSTVLSTDQHLHNLFHHIDRILSLPRAGAAQPAEKETCKILKAAHAVHVTSVITFLPTLLNQLFQLLVHTNSDEIGQHVIRLLVNLIHMVADDAGRRELLTAYVKYAFQTTNFTAKRMPCASVPPPTAAATAAAAAAANGSQPLKAALASSSSLSSNHSSGTTTSSSSTTASAAAAAAYVVHTVHGELCRHLPAILHPNNTDFLIVNKFMKYSGIFFDIIIKSIGQHLLATGRIRMLRNERLPATFAANLEQLVQVLITYLHGRHKELPAETLQLNRHLAAFLNRCMCYMDRGYVFGLVRQYVDRFRAGDPRTLHEFKFAFLAELCAHEHYVPLNLPFLLSPANRMPDIRQHFTLSEEFCRQHYLTGLLLQEVRCALNEVSPVRTLALGVLRDLVAKHDLDARYQKRGQQERIAMLYVPWLGIVLGNLERIANFEQEKRRNDSGSIVSQRFSSSYVDGAGSYVLPYQRNGGGGGGGGGGVGVTDYASAATASQRARNRVTLHIDHPSSGVQSIGGSPMRSSLHLRDAQWFAAISGSGGGGHPHGNGLGSNGCGSTASLDSPPGSSMLSQDTTIARHLANGNGVVHFGVNGGGGGGGLEPNGAPDASVDEVAAASVSIRPSHAYHNRSVSVLTAHSLNAAGGTSMPLPRCDKLTAAETKDMLIVFLFVVRHMSIDQMTMWWQSCTESETVQFFAVLEMCLLNFRYVGRKNVVVVGAAGGAAGGDRVSDQVRMRHQPVAKASTLPARIATPATPSTAPTTSASNNNDDETTTIAAAAAAARPPHESGTLAHCGIGRENLIDETARSIRALHESNLATEVGLVVLDSMGLYTLQFRDRMTTTGSSPSDGNGGGCGGTGTGIGNSLVLPRLARVYLRFLQLGQSETLSKHVFAALRAFINNFAGAVLFRGPAGLCGQLVYELLRCCDSRLSAVRQDACAVLYLLMRSNFEFSGRKGLTRVHLQVIISVSQMLGGTGSSLNNARFQESLSLINSYASSDKAMKGSGFPVEVKDLTRRVRTVLMATAQMQAHHTDPERLLELQLSLANSYASTPELRHTWLMTMARHHEQRGNVSEAACCHLHMAALMAEYLRLRGGATLASAADGDSSTNGTTSTMDGRRCISAESFARISQNIGRDEKGLKLDSAAGGTQDSQYTEQMLLDQLKECAELLDRAERYECLGELYRLIVPVYEERRDFVALAAAYEHLTQAYTKVTEVMRSGKRLLGRFYRVIFFGQMYFEEDSGIEYVYKEPKITSLAEISERLHNQYKEKFGADVVKIIMDSCVVDASQLDPKLAYVQITHVIPYFCKDELEERQTDFEQNHDVDTFMFETPFTRAGSARGNVEDQWKRRTVLTTQYTFPYVLKRIPIKDKQSSELSPIEVAIDEMNTRVAELEDVVLPPIDVKKLQLRLQGSVAVTVNAGALAYATAFLDPKRGSKYPDDRVEVLKMVFREFFSICHTALQINGRMICADQREYQFALQDNYNKLCTSMSDLLDESFLPPDADGSAQSGVHRQSMALFSAISGAPNNSSIA